MTEPHTAENDAPREPGKYVECKTGTQLWCTHLRCGYVPWSEVYRRPIPPGAGASPCEVHVPGRDEPSPWCAACRMSTTRPIPPAERAMGAIVPERQRCICNDGLCLDHCRACNHSGRDLEESCIADPDWQPDDDDLARREGRPIPPGEGDDCSCGHDHGVSTTTCDRCHWCSQ